MRVAVMIGEVTELLLWSPEHAATLFSRHRIDTEIKKKAFKFAFAFR